MTKLLQWLSAASIFFAIWISLVLELVPVNCAKIQEVLLPLPVYLLIVFGCYSLATIGYRVMTFNDCDEAAAELRKEIEEARADLTRKGVKLS
ncbi:dolichol-phosphate mannosyltransferase subunit 3-like [Sycon ciliatum]|uniref:dolichol-phosphate mannosyltransferase subunit 3-like n=1 Tax=Sycon ciliatum TaxID=27933 RepID=UPI0020ACB5F3